MMKCKQKKKNWKKLILILWPVKFFLQKLLGNCVCLAIWPIDHKNIWFNWLVEEWHEWLFSLNPGFFLGARWTTLSSLGVWILLSKLWPIISHFASCSKNTWSLDTRGFLQAKKNIFQYWIYESNWTKKNENEKIWYKKGKQLRIIINQQWKIK